MGDEHAPNAGRRHAADRHRQALPQPVLVPVRHALFGRYRTARLSDCQPAPRRQSRRAITRRGLRGYPRDSRRAAGKSQAIAGLARGAFRRRRARLRHSAAAIDARPIRVTTSISKRSSSQCRFGRERCLTNNCCSSGRAIAKSRQERKLSTRISSTAPAAARCKPPPKR